MHTTLNKIRAHSPCAEGWETLLRFLNKTGPDDEPVSVVTVLKSNGLDDAIWCLRAVDGFDREKRLFAVKCARRVQHLLKDQRSVNAIDVAEAHANGLASDEELRKARDVAWALAEEGLAGGVAAWAAAWAAARAAAEWADTAALGSSWGAGGAEDGAEREFQTNLFIEMFSSTQEEK